jgi:hypothetical protein
VYTFRARWAERWRDGRLLLAGDAAHQMPPFAGQGLCSGIRDAATLSWQLDLVLRGRAGEQLLDAYASERLAHLQQAIALSVELGKVICISDELEARARDDAMLALAADPGAGGFAPPAPALGPGAHDAEEPAGTLFPQAPADARDRAGSDGAGERFVLRVVDAGAGDLLDAPAAAYLDELDASTVTVAAANDPGGLYRAWFERHGAVAALVRPDSYVFGIARSPSQASGLVERLREALGAGTHINQERQTA